MPDSDIFGESFGKKGLHEDLEHKLEKSTEANSPEFGGFVIYSWKTSLYNIMVAMKLVRFLANSIFYKPPCRKPFNTISLPSDDACSRSKSTMKPPGPLLADFWVEKVDLLAYLPRPMNRR